MEHDLGLVDHHGYVGLGKRESGTSTERSALDSPPSLRSRDWHHLANYPYWIFVLWNRCYEERCCFPADLNIQLLLQFLWVYSSIDVHTLHVLYRQTLLSLMSCALSQFSPSTASKGWLALPITIILLLTTAFAKWRLGAWDIQELPLLAASSQMETTTMAGKSRQPSHEPPRGGRKQAPVTLIKQGKEREGQGTGGNSLQGIPMLRKTLMLRKRWLKHQQNCYNALWTKNTKNPGTWAYVYLTNRWPRR